MKIYKMYRVKGLNHPLEEPIFSGYTFSKEITKRYLEERKSGNYVCIEGEVTKDRKKDIMFNRISYSLDQYTINTKDPDDEVSSTNITLIMTDIEFNKLLQTEESFFTNISRFTRSDMDGFKKEYKIALKNLGYEKFRKFDCMNFTDYGMQDSYAAFESDSGFDFGVDIKIDELSILSMLGII